MYMYIYIYTVHEVYNPTYHWGASAYSVLVPQIANLRGDGSCHPDRADVHPNRTVPALGSLRGLRRFTAVSLANYS